MNWLETLFWTALAVAAYTYVGYGAIATLLAWICPRPHRHAPILPTVSLVVAAYNEEEVIEAKIRNCLALDYPRDRLEIVVVADGSSDRTADLVLGYAAEGIRLEFLPERRGKIHAMNRVFPTLSGDVIVFSDANAMLNPEALRLMVRHFSDPTVACVAGEKRVLLRKGNVSAGEGLYWRYESYLKRLDSKLSSVMGAAGELFAIRARLFEPVPEDTLLDDFVLSMRLVNAGYRVVYEPAAYAVEEASATVREEFKRKVRIVAGGWQAVLRLWPLLLPTRPLVWFQYVSHRVLRWVLVPHLLVAAFVANVVLALQGEALYQSLLGVHAAFYLAALMGFLLQDRGQRASFYYVPFYFTFLNYAALVGCYRFWTRSQPVTWEKARRVATN